MTEELVVRSQAALTIDEMVDQVTLIQKAMHSVMKKEEHYGVIPGTQKPTLFKPGAEKLCMLFRLAPSYELTETHEDNGHYSVRVICKLVHIPTGNFVGEGLGYCTTHESRYAYRKAQRVCPVCGIPAIIKGKAEYGGGWVCFKKIEGCGATFPDGDSAIEEQETGKIDNPDLADSYNTVLKMASKRALVAAVLVSTAASDIFAQDIEDLPQTGVQTVGAEALVVLKAALLQASDITPELWKDDAVLANARQRFGRNIQRLEDLTEKEAAAIIAGVEKWMEGNGPEVVETVEGEEVESV